MTLGVKYVAWWQSAHLCYLSPSLMGNIIYGSFITLNYIYIYDIQTKIATAEWNTYMYLTGKVIEYLPYVQSPALTSLPKQK